MLTGEEGYLSCMIILMHFMGIFIANSMSKCEEDYKNVVSLKKTNQSHKKQQFFARISVIR
jgi:hypothetical protein